jgi:hypothetical protein
VFFSNGEAMQRAGDSVAAYHVVNAGMTHAAIIGRHTRAAWAKTTRYMKNSQQEEEAWEIDKRLVPFVSIGVTT